jgi:hypothetical protein
MREPLGGARSLCRTVEMARYQPTVFTSWPAGLVLLVLTPSQVVAQAQRGGPPPATVLVAEQAWSAPSWTWQPTVSDSVYQSRADRSAARTIATHAVVGTGAGLLIGLVLSGASAGGDRTSVVLTWTALGAAAGVVSGVVTWLVGRR